ncbi:hypothetical protein [Syntrophomonas palmitatica]|uniref:hypothetical protein n=1 Tax=Syntrophomonas palmitatica TaxID=402877 RepID=UPI0006CFADF6|nr:hypothetical protein [Syntrophomonas palmitatica]
MKIYWFSRHDLTNGQVETLKTMGYNAHEKKDLVFNDQIIEQIRGITPDKIVALVAPLKYGLILLREGYSIIEFENVPSARQEGTFLCRGAWMHTLQDSKFFPCPVPLEAQEQGDLSYNGR